MIINQVDISPFALLVPLLLAEIYIFALGLSLFLSAAYVKFRDIGYIWEVLMQAGFYLTPILYPMSMIPSELFQKLLLLNPMAQAIQDIRYGLVTQQTLTISKAYDGGWLIVVPFIIVVISLVVGVWYFKKESKYFAENI